MSVGQSMDESGDPLHAPDPVQREYTRLAARYDRRWARYIEGTVRQTLARVALRPGDRVLDIGCGTGILLARLAGAVPGVVCVGLDLSREMLQIARIRLGPVVGLCLGRAERLPFGDGTFEFVVSTSVLHYVRDPEAVLREIIRVLVPGGQVVVTDWCADHPPCRGVDRLLRLAKSSHHRAYRANELAWLFREAGFADVNVERFRVGWLWGMMTARGHKPIAA